MLRQELVAALLASAACDEASCSAAVWALLWLTGARIRTWGASGKADRDARKVALLDTPDAIALEHLLQRPDIDPYVLAHGALVLDREVGIKPVGLQGDWIHKLARIADGAVARRALAPPGSTGRTRATDWLRDALRRSPPLHAGGRIALALGALGVLVPEMVRWLQTVFLEPRFDTPEDERDEALVYLALIGGVEVTQLLVGAADTSESVDYYRSSRGLFGLLLLDDVDVLAAQLHKALPHAALAPYAYGLAGSHDRRGRKLLEGMKRHGDPRVRTAAARALAAPNLRP